MSAERFTEMLSGLTFIGWHHLLCGTGDQPGLSGYQEGCLMPAGCPWQLPGTIGERHVTSSAATAWRAPYGCDFWAAHL